MDYGSLLSATGPEFGGNKLPTCFSVGIAGFSVHFPQL
jgi:hypothetical protein